MSIKSHIACWALAVGVLAFLGIPIFQHAVYLASWAA
jgi:hypothetical protein